MSLSTMRTAVVTACARSIEYMTSVRIMLFLCDFRFFLLLVLSEYARIARVLVLVCTDQLAYILFCTYFSCFFVLSLSQSGITEGFSTVENKADVASACDLHPAAGNIMYCCSEVQDYAAPYRRMRELSNAYYSRYYHCLLLVLVAMLVRHFQRAELLVALCDYPVSGTINRLCLSFLTLPVIFFFFPVHRRSSSWNYRQFPRTASLLTPMNSQPLCWTISSQRWRYCICCHL